MYSRPDIFFQDYILEGEKISTFHHGILAVLGQLNAHHFFGNGVFEKTECQIALEVLGLCQKFSVPITAADSSLRQRWRVQLNVSQFAPTRKNIQLA